MQQQGNILQRLLGAVGPAARTGMPATQLLPGGAMNNTVAGQERLQAFADLGKGNITQAGLMSILPMLFMGQVQAEPGASFSYGGDPMLQKNMEYHLQTKNHVDQLTQAVKSGKLTLENLLNQVSNGSLNQDIFQRVSQNVNGLELVTQFNEAMDIGDIRTAEQIFAKALQAGKGSPIFSYLDTMASFFK